MEIDEAIINQRTLETIQDSLGDIYEYAKDNSTAGLTIAEISGILRMAYALKEAVRA